VKKISADALEKQTNSLIEAAHRGTLTEAILAIKAREYYYVHDLGLTTSVGISWMQEQANLFHRIVRDPLDFHRKFILDGPYAVLILCQKEYLTAIRDESQRYTFVESVIRQHSIGNILWVQNLLEIGMEAHRVRALVVSRLRLDQELGVCTRATSFTQAFLNEGHKFFRPKTVYHGVWHLLGKEVFFEEVHLIADLLPQKVLARIEAIREEFYAPTDTLVIRCVKALTSLSGINARYLVLVKIHELYQLLMRVKINTHSREEVELLFLLLSEMIIRLDPEKLDAAIFRVRGLTQSVESALVYQVMTQLLPPKNVCDVVALQHWSDEIHHTMVQGGWIFSRAELILIPSPLDSPKYRIGCRLNEQIYLHDRYAGWEINVGDDIMFLPSQAEQLKHVSITRLHSLKRG